MNPLVGYSLEVTAVADAGAAGSVTADPASTNFFDQRNLITAGGATRDPLFSVIQDNGSGGVTVDTVTADFSAVLAVDDMNDVLAQVFFDVPLDALGDFTIQLGWRRKVRSCEIGRARDARAQYTRQGAA